MHGFDAATKCVFSAPGHFGDRRTVEVLAGLSLSSLQLIIRIVSRTLVVNINRHLKKLSFPLVTSSEPPVELLRSPKTTSFNSAILRLGRPALTRLKRDVLGTCQVEVHFWSILEV